MESGRYYGGSIHRVQLVEVSQPAQGDATGPFSHSAFFYAYLHTTCGCHMKLPYIAFAFAAALFLTASADAQNEPRSFLLPGQSLVAKFDQALVAGDMRFVMQHDCNLVVYHGAKAVWATNTNKQGPGCVTIMQGDGNLVLLRSDGKVLWASNTNRHPGAWVTAQPDGNLVIYQPGNAAKGRALWATNTVEHNNAPVPTAAKVDYGPYTCVNGLVWREAVPQDYVCVSPSWRQKTWDENARGASLRQPGGGAYGPDTCKQGAVWRETRPSDHVCVLFQSRSRDDNRRANKGAYAGYAHPEQLPRNATESWWAQQNTATTVDQLLVRPAAGMVFYSWEPGRGYVPLTRNLGISSENGGRMVTPPHCQKSSNRSMYVIAVDEVTGVVSNAGRVAFPLCLPELT